MIDSPLDAILHQLRLPVDHDHWAARLRGDPLFAAEMRVCREWRIPHSEFLAWDAVDREKAIAYVAHEAARCGQCGVHPDDWPSEDDDRWEVEGRRCFGCQATQRYLADIRARAVKRNGEPDGEVMFGLHTVVKRREG